MTISKTLMHMTKKAKCYFFMDGSPAAKCYFISEKAFS